MEVTQKNPESQKQYEEYIKQFQPKPKYISNCLKAFLVGGGICLFGSLLQYLFINYLNMDQKASATAVSCSLVCIAQLLTGFGVYDTIGKFAGAGSMIPITGFANAMVASAIEYKKEGIVLGVGSKIFSLAGPVLACGITVSALIGIVYRIGGF